MEMRAVGHSKGAALVLALLLGTAHDSRGQCPPVITTQPADQTACAGSSETFSIAASAGAPLSYQWRRNGVNLVNGPAPSGATISGATTATLTITAVGATDTGWYDCLVDSTCGSAGSDRAAMDVNCTCATPLLQMHGDDDDFTGPEPTTPRGLLEDCATNYLGASAIGFDETPAGGSSRSVFADSFIGLPTDAIAGTLTLHLRAGGGGGQGQPVNDTVRLGFADAALANCGIPGFWSSPISAFHSGGTWRRGDEVSFSLDLTALANGSGSLLAQMNSRGFLDIIIEHKTAVDYATLTLTRPQPPQVLPWVACQPQSAEFQPGGGAMFCVCGNTAGAPFTYQWYKNGAPAPGATAACLTLMNLRSADNHGRYHCVISNPCASVTSDDAELTLRLASGDMNCDGLIDGDDIEGFVQALIDPSQYIATHPTCDIRFGDVNHDQFVDTLDVLPYVQCLMEGTCHGADLVMQDIAILGCVQQGQPVHVRLSVRNAGDHGARGDFEVCTWLSPDASTNNPGALPIGRCPFSLVDALLPGGVVTQDFMTNPVPSSAQLGNQRFIACADCDPYPCGDICELNENNNCDSRAVNVGSPDVAIRSVSCAPGTFLSGATASISFSVENLGCGGLDVPVRVRFGPNSANSQLVHVNVPGAGVFPGVAGSVPVPQVTCTTGQPLTVTATAELTGDCNTSNDSADCTATVEAQFWDLDFTICNYPTAPICRSNFLPITWSVCVTNRGNFASPSVCAFSGIAPSAVPGNWSNNLGLNYFTVPPLGPGQSWLPDGQHPYSVGNYFVPCNASTGTQYIRVEINYNPGGCDDPCNPNGNNFDAKPVQINNQCGC